MDDVFLSDLPFENARRIEEFEFVIQKLTGPAGGAGGKSTPTHEFRTVQIKRGNGCSTEKGEET